MSKSDVSEELRKSFDSNDPFMTNGHQILKIRRTEKRVPLWLFDNAKVQKILLQSFPRMKEDAIQRKKAGRWVRIIQLHFRQNWTRGQVAAELGISYNAVHCLIRRIKGCGVPRKRVGRPRKGQPHRNTF